MVRQVPVTDARAVPCSNRAGVTTTETGEPMLPELSRGVMRNAWLPASGSVTSRWVVADAALIVVQLVASTRCSIRYDAIETSSVAAGQVRRTRTDEAPSVDPPSGTTDGAPDRTGATMSIARRALSRLPDTVRPVVDASGVPVARRRRRIAAGSASRAGW